jgi:hypothetical protein
VDRGARRILLVALAVLVAAGLLVVRHRAVHDLRTIEHAYLAAREPTACATAALAPSAFTPDLDELPSTVLRLVTEARDDSRVLREDYRRERSHVWVWLPALRRADRALGRALDAQVALYDEMISDPQGSDPELRALGLANTELEHQLAIVRRQLLSGEAADWKRRFVCDE